MELGLVLDGDDTLVSTYEPRQNSHEGGLACTCATRYQDVEPGSDCSLEKPDQLLRQEPRGRQCIEVAEPIRWMPPDGDAHGPSWRRQRGVQPAAFRQRHRHRWARAIEPCAGRAVRVPMHELDQPGLVCKRRRQYVPMAALEDKASFGSVDPHFLDLWIREMLGQRPKRSHCREDAAPHLLGLFMGRWRRRLTLLLTHDSTDELVDPVLIVDAQAGAIAPRQLSGKLHLDERTQARLGCRRIMCHHGVQTRAAHRPATTAIASSGPDIGSSTPSAAPGSATTAARCMVAAANTNAAACFAGTATIKPPETAARTSTPSANVETVGRSGAPPIMRRSTLAPGAVVGAPEIGMKTR